MYWELIYELDLSTIPSSHITANQQIVEAEPYHDLYELAPVTGGVVRFHAFNEVSWLGNTYEGLPLKFTGDGSSGDGKKYRPTMNIYQGETAAFKAYVHDGHLDGAILTRYRVLHEDVEENINVKQTRLWICTPKSYNRQVIVLECRRLSDGPRIVLPARTFSIPEFPTVDSR